MLRLTNQEIREKMTEFCPGWEGTVEKCLDKGEYDIILMVIDNELRYIQMTVEDTDDLDELQTEVARGIQVENFYNQLQAAYPMACPA